MYLLDEHRSVRGVLGDVGDPQLVRAGAGEVSFDQVSGDVVRLDPLPPRSFSHALQAGAAHRALDLAVAHLDPASEGELGVYSVTAVAAAGVAVDLDDEVVSRAWRIERGEGVRLIRANQPHSEIPATRQAIWTGVPSATITSAAEYRLLGALTPSVARSLAMSPSARLRGQRSACGQRLARPSRRLTVRA
nr:hypothetical protein [Nocardioides kribbensis]